MSRAESAAEKHCEHVFDGEQPCASPAAWLVKRLYRQADAQLSCRRHLSATVTALIGIDTGERAAVTVSAAGMSSG